MDREYLEDYEQRENEEYERLLKDVQEDRFSFEKDRYPPDERFVKLQRPVAFASFSIKKIDKVWAQIPFSGSTVLLIPSFPKHLFEEYVCKISDISKIIDFVKDTGRLQIALNEPPTLYEGLEYLDLIFSELTPPVVRSAPLSVFEKEKEIERALDIFFTIAKVKFLGYLEEKTGFYASRGFQMALSAVTDTYLWLKLGRYSIVENIENLMMDDPQEANLQLILCRDFIARPFLNLSFDVINYSFNEVKRVSILPRVHQPKELRFPFEIGSFLLTKLTHAPQGVRACEYLIDHYKGYDLQKVQKSLNEAIVTSHPDIVEKNAKELYEILDNVWNDKTIPKRIENIKIGVPVSIAAVGGVAGAIVGGLVGGPGGAVIGGTSGLGVGDFFTRLGFKVGEKAVEKFFRVRGEQVSEKIAKLRTKSYQANIYDFKKKYSKTKQ